MSQLTRSILDCPCGKPHICPIKAVEIGEGALLRLPRICADGSHILLVADRNTYAACGKNMQSGIIVAVTNRELRDRISAMNNKIYGGEEGFDPFYGAPAILVVLAKKDSPHKIYDGSLIMGNMMLAAHECGLGSCWIQVRQRFTADGVSSEDYVREMFGIPEQFGVLSVMTFGYKDEERKPYDPEKTQWEKVHIGKW